MTGTGTPALIAALICFVIFFGNVVVGASGAAVFLNDIGEMLMLFAASAFFVIGLIAREAKEMSNKNEPSNG